LTCSSSRSSSIKAAAASSANGIVCMHAAVQEVQGSNVAYISHRCLTPERSAPHLLCVAGDALFALQQCLRPAGDDAEHVSSGEGSL
jgi:hypothetical protein